MTQERSPERRRPSTERQGVDKKVRRVSHRKEFAVVTLGMVAAISGVGGLLATNPPSWAKTTESVPAGIVAKTAGHNERVRQAAVQRALQKGARQKDTAREAAARAKTAREESKRAARQPQQAAYSAQPQASASASASAAASTASASAVSRGS